ncbi:PREDICTED: interferon-induced, double-stranded RNA-activated protein kinase isoform X2 [Sturnus vulgaris]|uniref:interferon-induced, double-stranded RNA-activated protein kinase isoform X2 n=1 Tax=Sturnus vulgaris TaxID=9172 RepID=UPI00071A2C53|nr:PREDICTED: interferon-induced, double-stranded RNA-activated protein kinase isoform X2 [Sturnus vulgaris]
MEGPRLSECGQQLGASLEDCAEMDCDYMGKINRYCQIHKFRADYKLISRTGPDHDPEFKVVVKINGEDYATGTGKSKKEAKALAAKETWKMIEKQDSPSNMAAAELGTTQRTSSLASDKDYVSLLNVYSLKTSHIVDYCKNACTGDAHAPTYSLSCIIDDQVCGMGTGPSLMAAKQAAAKEAYEKVIIKKANGTCTSDSENRICSVDSAAKLEENMKDMAICEKPSPLQRNAPSSVLKSKRKLAANFADIRNKKEEKNMSDSNEGLPDKDTKTGEENGSPHTVNQTFLDHFEAIEPIDEGGFGTVFKATSKSDKTTYAIKRVEFTEKVQRESEGLAGLTHENIVRYHFSWKGYDYIKDPDSSLNPDRETLCLFIQLEFCEKGTLEKWIAQNREKQQYHAMAQNIFLQIVKGVQYIHSKDLIHRDLKPQNIFISRDDIIKIGDFGLVTSVTFETLTENRGTKSYMAPEQFGDRYGKEVDIYALGLIWFEILSASTCHEKARVWPSVRQGNLPESFINRFPTEASIIKRMLSRSGRITVSHLLDFIKSAGKEKALKNYSC